MEMSSDSASPSQDIAWLAFLSLAMGTAMTQIWALILRHPRLPLKGLLKTTVRTFFFGIPVTLLDRILESEGYLTRLNGRFPPIITILAVLQMTVIPGVVWMVFLTGTRMPTLLSRKKMNEAAMNRILWSCRAPTEEVCVICRGDFDQAVELPCRHVFCDDCIRLALRARGACPICSRKYA
jgi:hypothetical protein